MNLFSFLNIILAQGFELPPPRAWTLRDITEKILDPLSKFFITAGILGGFIFIVISGIMYMKAGSDEKAVKNALAWFRNSVIGVFIILAVYLIINTIGLIVTGRFFR